MEVCVKRLFILLCITVFAAAAVSAQGIMDQQNEQQNQQQVNEKTQPRNERRHHVNPQARGEQRREFTPRQRPNNTVTEGERPNIERRAMPQNRGNVYIYNFNNRRQENVKPMRNNFSHKRGNAPDRGCCACSCGSK